MIKKRMNVRSAGRGILPSLWKIAPRMRTSSAFDDARTFWSLRDPFWIMSTTMPLEEHEITPLANHHSKLFIQVLLSYH